MKAEFTAIIEPAREGGFWATCPEVAGANGQGETVEEAKQNLTEAIRLILDERLVAATSQLSTTAIRDTISIDTAVHPISRTITQGGNSATSDRATPSAAAAASGQPPIHTPLLLHGATRLVLFLLPVLTGVVIWLHEALFWTNPQDLLVFFWMYPFGLMVAFEQLTHTRGFDIVGGLILTYSIYAAVALGFIFATRVRTILLLTALLITLTAINVTGCHYGMNYSDRHIYGSTGSTP